MLEAIQMCRLMVLSTPMSTLTCQGEGHLVQFLPFRHPYWMGEKNCTHTSIFQLFAQHAKEQGNFLKVFNKPEARQSGDVARPRPILQVCMTSSNLNCVREDSQIDFSTHNGQMDVISRPPP